MHNIYIYIRTIDVKNEEKYIIITKIMQIIWVIICHRGKSGTPQALHCMNPMDFSTLGMKPVALNSSPEINKSEHKWSNNQESLSKHAMGWQWLEKTVTSWAEQKKHMLTWIDLIGSHLRISLKSQVLTFHLYIYIYYKYHISSVKFSNSSLPSIYAQLRAKLCAVV